MTDIPDCITPVWLAGERARVQCALTILTEVTCSYDRPLLALQKKAQEHLRIMSAMLSEHLATVEQEQAK